MKVDLTDLSPVKKQMLIEVEPDEIEKETRSVVQGYRQKARIPGFRPGKAPVEVIRKRFSHEIEKDVRERVLTRSFFKAADEQGLRPLGQPEVADLKHDAGGPMVFKATFEILPGIELKDYKKIELRRPSSEVDDPEVDAALEEIRRSRAVHVFEEGRSAAEGDVVVVDIEGTPEEGEPFKRERMQIEMGAQHNLPEFNEHLLGCAAGAEKAFDVKYPDDYQGAELAGKTVTFRATVHEVKRREVPELDDEFAKDLGSFDDLAALRQRVREDLQARKDAETDGALRQSLLDKVLLANPVVLPDILVDHETRRRLEDMVRNMAMQGMDPEKAEIDWVEMRKRQEEPARKSVHARLILDAVAAAENIEVENKEVDERIGREARRLDETPAALRKRLQEHGGMETLRSQMVREKSLDYLLAVANIQK